MSEKDFETVEASVNGVRLPFCPPHMNLILRHGSEEQCVQCECNRLREQLAERDERIKQLTEERDAIRDASFCTTCGWSGVPQPWIKHPKSGITLSWMCGRWGCEYQVPTPKSALIKQLTERAEGAEAVRDENGRAVFDLSRQLRAAMAGERGWRCFHCDQAFFGYGAALEHFGRSSGDIPQCQKGVE